MMWYGLEKGDLSPYLWLDLYISILLTFRISNIHFLSRRPCILLLRGRSKWIFVRVRCVWMNVSRYHLRLAFSSKRSLILKSQRPIVTESDVFVRSKVLRFCLAIGTYEPTKEKCEKEELKRWLLKDGMVWESLKLEPRCSQTECSMSVYLSI